MPCSSNIFNIETERILAEINATNILDVGIGSGKYGNILRRLSPNCNIVGCEIDPSYLIEFKERHQVYNSIINKSILDVVNETEHEYDLVIFGDILEHLKYSDVLNVLDYFQYRTKYILLSYPTALRQGIWHGHISERHMCDIRLSDLVKNYNIIHYEKKLDTSFYMNLCVLRGYIN